jgi:hypothetical protein
LHYHLHYCFSDNGTYIVLCFQFSHLYHTHHNRVLLNSDYILLNPVINPIIVLIGLVLLAVIIRQIRPYVSLCSFILLVSGFILLAIAIIQSLITSPLKVSGSETYRYILEYFTVPVSVVTVLFDAFLVKPYFREVTKTGNELRDINIREVTVNDVEGKREVEFLFLVRLFSAP